MTKENWNEIVKHYNENTTTEEVIIEQDWVQILTEFFGYSKIKKEINTQQKLTIGSKERIIPDILIRENNKNSFIIELKRYSRALDKTIEDQLLSYMKFLDLQVGLIICNKIYVCIKHDNELIKQEIDFIEDSENGINFINLFQKGQFDEHKIREYILNNQTFENHVKEIQEEITAEFLQTLTKDYLKDLYTEKEISKAFENIKIEVTTKSISHPDPDPDPDPGPNPPPGNPLTKSQAYIILSKRCPKLRFGDMTFSTKNAGANIYWSNPPVTKLSKEWFLVLYDNIKQELHLFVIPAFTLKPTDVRVRHDQKDKIDLQITYGDPNFTDSRSNISFKKFENVVVKL